ncbi:hypothetical protein GCM10010358_20600 [Streptomyces minutiscleroticus]|uniref:Uncharacterized protein n=1 Tax=Streptomyces minutiscleroticus TaxID=68238 RepID=A0A918KJY8_9ACTN|nr:hypothetical protein GCM10010358_20600 [Streptomyces minutiscleroticus]
MAGAKGWYSAIGRNQPGMVSVGTEALETRGRRISGMALLLAASAFGPTRPVPTAIQTMPSAIPPPFGPSRERIVPSGAARSTPSSTTSSP